MLIALVLIFGWLILGSAYLVKKNPTAPAKKPASAPAQTAPAPPVQATAPAAAAAKAPALLLPQVPGEVDQRAELVLAKKA